MQALRDVLQRAHIVGLGVDKDLHIVRKSIPHGHLLGEPRVIVELGSFGRALADQAAKPSPKPPRSLSDVSLPARACLHRQLHRAYACERANAPRSCVSWCSASQWTSRHA